MILMRCSSKVKHTMRNKRKHRGAVAVEMAITLPILFIFLFAALEFCGMNNLRHTADNAAYEGARKGILPGATAVDVTNEAQRIMTAIGAQNVTVSVTPAVLTEDTPELEVLVNVPIAGNGWIAPIYFRGRTALTGRCLMIREDY